LLLKDFGKTRKGEDKRKIGQKEKEGSYEMTQWPYSWEREWSIWEQKTNRWSWK